LDSIFKNFMGSTDTGILQVVEYFHGRIIDY
jgi:hypothetical protein